MNFGEAIKSVFSKYATFSGRARRSEFWYFVLFNFIVSFVLGLIPFLTMLAGLWALAVLIPSLAVTVRRLHDIGKSGWWYLLQLIPTLAYSGIMFSFIFKVAGDAIRNGEMADTEQIIEYMMENSSSLVLMGLLALLAFIVSIVFIVWMAKDSQPGENQWGPNPKEQANSEVQDFN